ncbi:hypothetical protein BT69DRAFT_1320032 [Atractiella rhizophila]|nr:hypothetical protein BT69DRAFT_1320032 [Atractiella rhizophila]
MLYEKASKYLATFVSLPFRNRDRDNPPRETAMTRARSTTQNIPRLAEREEEAEEEDRPKPSTPRRHLSDSFSSNAYRIQSLGQLASSLAAGRYRGIDKDHLEVWDYWHMEFSRSWFVFKSGGVEGESYQDDFFDIHLNLERVIEGEIDYVYLEIIVPDDPLHKKLGMQVLDTPSPSPTGSNTPNLGWTSKSFHRSVQLSDKGLSLYLVLDVSTCQTYAFDAPRETAFFTLDRPSTPMRTLIRRTVWIFDERVISLGKYRQITLGSFQRAKWTERSQSSWKIHLQPQMGRTIRTVYLCSRREGVMRKAAPTLNYDVLNLIIKYLLFPYFPQDGTFRCKDWQSYLRSCQLVAKAWHESVSDFIWSRVYIGDPPDNRLTLVDLRSKIDVVFSPSHLRHLLIMTDTVFASGEDQYSDSLISILSLCRNIILLECPSVSQTDDRPLQFLDALCEMGLMRIFRLRSPPDNVDGKIYQLTGSDILRLFSSWAGLQHIFVINLGSLVEIDKPQAMLLSTPVESWWMIGGTFSPTSYPTLSTSLFPHLVSFLFGDASSVDFPSFCEFLKGLAHNLIFLQIRDVEFVELLPESPSSSSLSLITLEPRVPTQIEKPDLSPILSLCKSLRTMILGGTVATTDCISVLPLTLEYIRLCFLPRMELKAVSDFIIKRKSLVMLDFAPYFGEWEDEEVTTLATLCKASAITFSYRDWNDEYGLFFPHPLPLAGLGEVAWKDLSR